MLKQIWNTAKSEYISWLINPRMVLLFGALLFIYSFVIEQFHDKMELMENQFINLFEPYISVINSPFTVLIMPLCYLLLMSDYPQVHPNSLLILHRVGRVKWVLGQLLFFLLTSLTFIAAILLVSTVPTMSDSFIANGWSMVTLDFGSVYPELRESAYAALLPSRVYNHLLPFETVIFSTLTFVGYFMIVGLVLTLCKIRKLNPLGIFISAGIIGLGYATYFSDSFFQWFFPMSNSLLHTHYATVLREEKFPIIISIMYFPVVIIILFALVMASIRNADLIEA